MKIPTEISSRHLHVSQKDLEKLFGKNHKLTVKKILSQPTEFAANETVDIKYKDRVLKKIRIVAPVRKKTQVELSGTDAFNLGLNVPFGHSGKAKGAGGVILLGKKGKVRIKSGVIIPLRHIHLSREEAKKLGIRNGQLVSVKVGEKRAVTFHNILVRTGNYKVSMHLDTDEANAAGIKIKAFGKLV